MLARFRQLYALTESSNSSIVMLGTFESSSTLSSTTADGVTTGWPVIAAICIKWSISKFEAWLNAVETSIEPFDQISRVNLSKSIESPTRVFSTL